MKREIILLWQKGCNNDDDDDENELFGGGEVKQSFQKFPPAFWQTNACNAKLPTSTANIVQLKFGFDLNSCLPYNLFTNPWFARGPWFFQKFWDQLFSS